MTTYILQAVNGANPRLSVPASKYALQNGSSVDFYQVDQPTSGNGAGRTFVSRLIGAPGNWRKINLYGGESAGILAEIALNPRAAAKLYSVHYTECAKCASPLSDPQSIADGLGPVCVNSF